MEEGKLLVPLLEQLKEILLLCMNTTVGEEVVEQLLEQIDDVLEGIFLNDEQAPEKLLALLVPTGKMERIAFDNDWSDIFQEIKQMTIKVVSNGER